MKELTTLLLLGTFCSSSLLGKGKTDSWDIAFSLLQSQTKQEATVHNTCLSPLSLQLALALVDEGASGKTHKEINKLLPARTDELFATLNGHEALSLANSVWINQHFAPQVKEGFKQANVQKYEAEIQALPFDDQAKAIINGWCKQKTQGLIPSAIDRLDNGQSMILVNALHFKADWKLPFRSQRTQDKDFFLSNGTTKRVPMMDQTSHFEYAESESCQAICLPYKGNDGANFAMYIVLPKEGTSLKALLSTLNRKTWKNFAFHSSKVHLQLPKWESDFSTDLNESVKALGAKRLFTSKANFQKISKTDLRVGSINQKTLIRVDEKGTEAAAVTTISMVTTALPKPEKIYEMNVNRPFLYILVEEGKDLPVFIGTQTWE